MTITRRDFFKSASVAGSAITVPYFWTSLSAGAQQASGKRTVASIGLGGSRGRYSQGRAIALSAAAFGDMIAVCDVDDRHTAEFNQEFDGKLAEYRDYRELLETEKPDVVTIGTPDHWHVPIAIAALRSGADVYCEKPLTLTIEEGIRIRDVVEETGCVFQVGTQQRSENDRRFLKAIAMVQSGRLGKNVNAYLAIGGAPGEGPFESTEAPPDLDWDMWVGPAPQAEYCQQRRLYFRWYYEYSGGKLTDWGAHHIDIAQWAIGAGDTGPVEVGGAGKFPPIIPDNFNWDAFLEGQVTLPNGYNTATQFHVDLKFANGSIISVNNHYRREAENVDFDNGILFEGDEGRIFVNRGRLSGRPVEELTEQDNVEIENLITKLYKGKQPGSHMKNFFDCLETREQPISDVASHHRTMTSCHLCNIALMLGRTLRWNPISEEFESDDQATALMSRGSRKGFATETAPA